MTDIIKENILVYGLKMIFFARLIRRESGH